jgi:transposase
VITDDPISQVTQLQQQLELQRQINQQLIEQHQQQTRLIDSLQEQIQQLMRRMYGRSSEKLDANQLTLFADLLKQLQPDEPLAPAPQPEPKPRSTTQGHGRRQIPADLPRVRQEKDLPESEKPCPCCGKIRCKIGEEISEKLNYVPARIEVLQTVRFKYACPDCEKNGNGPQIVLPPLPFSPIEKGLAAPGLLAYVIVSKYSDHLPLHRLEKILERHRIDIARSTMCDWMAGCAQALRPVYDLMVADVLQSKVIHTDDTPVDVLDKSRTDTRTGRFWVYLGNKEHPYTIFDYTPNRSRDGPVAFLKDWGKDKPVYLQADAFGGYDVIYRKEGTHVTEVACWAHARRKFYDARDSDATRGTQALAFIRLLYDVENQAKDLKPVERAKLRQEQAVPRLQQFKAWLEQQQAVNGGSILPKSAMGTAIQYALNQWDALCVYTNDGDLNMDNNAAENALRRIAVGRNNWTFLGADSGGHTAAILFSFIATCERHQVNAFDYLHDVLGRIASTPMSQLPELLPGQWQTR